MRGREKRDPQRQDPRLLAAVSSNPMLSEEETLGGGPGTELTKSAGSYAMAGNRKRSKWVSWRGVHEPLCSRPMWP